MNANLPHIPNRECKKRNMGITMVMDKGLSINEVKNFIQVSGEYVDYVKLGFGTGMITPKLEEKIKLYKEASIEPYFGGTLYEVFKIRDLFDQFMEFIDKYRMDVVEVSDGAINMSHDKKLEDISRLAENHTVLSEVGSKKADEIITPEAWKSQIKSELDAGSHKVITEARESGTIGIFNKNGTAREDLIDDISHHVKIENILWEAPQKSQQVWFIKHFGNNVNLGNIAHNEVIPLETLRLGLRGDTFFEFLPDELKDNSGN
ncbi:MAG: phosphosulfolactate synthase [Bacteroidales bacterium]|nr:phosphosulfolactate synthase [Bacteroidales bacterium]MBS3774339.1 phosphosulfolactate synthase [Bacteroidales bacterium]